MPAPTRSPSRPRRLARWGAAVLAAVCMGGAAGTAAAAIPRTSEGKPSFTGLWLLDDEMRSYGRGAGDDVPGGWFGFNGFRGPVPKPALRPETFQKVYDQKALEQSAVSLVGGVDPQTAVCMTSGFPDYLAHGDPLEILERDNKLVFITERERFFPRHVYIGHEHPDPEDYVPTYNGHSIAHWEGDTLVTDTIAFDPGPWLLMYDRIPRSEQLHVVERLRLEEDGAVLINSVTVNDPGVLTEPWIYELRYTRAPPGQEHYESICVPNDGGPPEP